MNTTQPIGKIKIIESALREFADKGFDGARMDRIASDAGVNKALIYYHFKNKDELYIETTNYLFAEAVMEPDMMVGGSVRDRFLEILEQFIAFLHHNPLFIKMMDQEALRGGSLFEKANQQLRIVEQLLRLYETGVKNGECRKCEHPLDLMMSILGACYFYYSHRNNIQLFYAPMSDDEVLQMRMRTLKDMAEKLLFTLS